jgi:hypothetical protein
MLAPILYERGYTLFLFWKNAPERLVKINTFASHEVKFADSIRSCEDALLVESEGLAIVGCDPGRERWNTVMVGLDDKCSFKAQFFFLIFLILIFFGWKDLRQSRYFYSSRSQSFEFLGIWK